MRAWTVCAVLFSVIAVGPLLNDVAAGWQMLQPGDPVNVGGAGCTLNFVYDGNGSLAGNVYMGTAAHCVGSVGQSARTGGVTWGHVAFIGNACCTTTDYAFIEVLPEFQANINPSVRGHPSVPTGVSTWQTTLTGEPVYISGYGSIYNINEVTRHQRVGSLVADTATYYQIAGPIYYGDSGGPITSALGPAIGVVSRGIPPAYDEGPTVEGLLAHAAGQGFTVTLRTV